MTLLLKSSYEEPQEWRARLAELLPGVALRVWPELGAAGDIVMLAVDGAIPDGLLPRLLNLKCIQYLGHGAADAAEHPERPGHVTVSRLTDPGIIGAMTEYALTALLRRRWHLATYDRQQEAAEWRWHPVPAAPETRVAVLGLGSIGTRVARALADLGFAVTGWARGPHEIEGVDCRHGPEALERVLAEADYVVGILPGTDATKGLFDAARFAAMKPGAYLVNIGRGHLIEVEALIEALDSGHLAGVTLDVFEAEPLAPDNPLWRHPKVTVTPHIAGGAPTGSIPATAENYRRMSAGEPPLDIVEPGRGY